jgi:gluconolactonase
VLTVPTQLISAGFATAAPSLSGPGFLSSESPAIYSFDIDEDLFPVNKRLIGIARNGIPDGIKVDDKGRVWTGEGEGIVVRNPKGKVIGVFNSETLLASPNPPLANFALAGDTLVILAMTRLWTLKLAETVVSPARYEF